MGVEDSLGGSLAASLRSDHAVAIATEAAEMGVDAALSDGLLRDIPVVSTLVSVAKLGLTVRDILFARKLLNFLRMLKDVPSEDRKAMVDKLENDPGYGRNAGEHLIEIIERIDAHRKPEMTARVFSAYVSGRIDIRTLHRLNNAIDRIPFYEIDAVRSIHERYKTDGKADFPEATYHALENAGLMYAASGFGSLVYLPSDLCEVFVDLQLDRVGI